VSGVGSLDCVLLAAGRSSRTTEWKMLLPCGGATVLEASVDTALAVCARAVVVAGFRAAELVRLFRGRERVEVVVNPRYEEGMFSSVCRGAAAVRTPRFFLALGDMPLVSAETYRVLLAAPAVDAVIPKHLGKKGHPLLLSGGVARAVATAPPGASLRDVLASVATLLVPVEDPHVLHDIDTDEDFRTLLAEPRADRAPRDFPTEA
jgi:molybdenum cofactor cytidylyltransferase